MRRHLKKLKRFRKGTKESEQLNVERLSKEFGMRDLRNELNEKPLPSRDNIDRSRSYRGRTNKPSLCRNFRQSI